MPALLQDAHIRRPEYCEILVKWLDGALYSVRHCLSIQGYPGYLGIQVILYLFPG